MCVGSYTIKAVILRLVPRIQNPGAGHGRIFGETGSLDHRHKGEDDELWARGVGAESRELAHV
jgi:hypothetical protein